MLRFSVTKPGSCGVRLASSPNRYCPLCAMQDGADRPLVGDVVGQPQLALMHRHARQPVAGVDGDVAVGIGRRVAAGGLDEAALVGRVGIGVGQVRGPARRLVLDAGIQPLPARLADIGEERPVQRHAVDEDDVVVEIAAVETEIVAQSMPSPMATVPRRPTSTRVRDHLLQVRDRRRRSWPGCRNSLGPAQESSAGVGARFASA